METKVTTSVEIITPDIAKEMLSRNVSNRPIKKQAVDYYVQEIKEGKWMLNGESICFSPEGVLLDGQHRLTAVVESGMSIQSVVVRGIDKSSFATYDTGRNRDASDAFAISEIKNSRCTSSIVARYMSKKLRKQNNLFLDGINCRPGKKRDGARFTIGDILDEYYSHQELFDEIVQFSRRVSGNSVAKVMTCTEIGAAAAYLILERNHYKNLVFRFFTLMMDIDDNSSDAICLFRNKIIQMKFKSFSLSPLHKANLFAKAWNAYVLDKPIKRLSWDGEKEENIELI